MRTYDRTCDRMLQNPHIAYFSTYNCVFKIAYAEIMSHNAKISISSHISACMRSHFSASYRLLSVKCTVTRHTVQYRLLIKDWLVPYRHLLGLTVSLIQCRLQTVKGVARISLWWSHRSSAKGAIIEAPSGVRRGSGCPPPHWGWGLGSRAGLRLNWAWCCCPEKAYFLLSRGDTAIDHDADPPPFGVAYRTYIFFVKFHSPCSTQSCK